MVIKKCKKWWQYIGLTEKIEKPNQTESIRFGLVTKSNLFSSVLQKLAKTEPNRPMLTPTWHPFSFVCLFISLSLCVRARANARVERTWIEGDSYNW